MAFTMQKVFKLSLAVVSVYILAFATGLWKICILALLLAFLAAPLKCWLQRARYLHKFLALRSGVAAVMAFGFIFCICGLLLWFICTPLIQEFRQFYAELPFFFKILQQNLLLFSQNFLLPLAYQFELKERLEFLLLLIESFAADGAAFTVQLVQKMTLFSMSAAGHLFDLAVIPVLAFYFLRDYDIMLDGFLKLFSLRIREKMRAFLRAFGQMLADFVYGQLILCLAVGFCMFAGLSCLGVKYPLLLGAAAAVLEAVPIAGPFVSTALAGALSLTVSLKLTGQVVLFCLVLQLVENNVLAPRIMGRSLKLPPAVVLLSLLVGGRLLGFMGMFAALPAAAGLKLLIEYFWNAEDV